MKENENIAVIGREIDAVILTILLKKLNIRNRITLITDTNLPGFFRSKLPFLLTNQITLEDLVLYRKSLLEEIYTIKIKKVKNLDYSLAKDISSIYDKIFLASITKPTIQKTSSIHLSTPENIQKIKTKIKDKKIIVGVYGNVWGIWTADILSKNGYNTILYVSKPSFYKEYFDEDIWKIILNESSYKFKIKIIEENENTETISLIYGLEKPIIENIDNIPDNIIPFGSSKISTDVLLRKKFFHLSEPLTIIQSKEKAFLTYGFHISGYTRYFLSKMGKFYIVSIGFNKESLNELNIKTSSTRLRLPIYEKNDKEEIIIKAIADRESRKIIGFQIISTSILALSYAEYAYSLLLMGRTLSNMQLLPNSFLPNEKFFYNPLNKVLYSLCVKTLEYG